MRLPTARTFHRSDGGKEVPSGGPDAHSRQAGDLVRPPFLSLLILLAFTGALASPQMAPEDIGVLTPVVEAALGERALKEFLQTHPLSDGPALAERVERVGRRVAAASDRPSAVADVE